MSKPGRPRRAALALTILIVLALGGAAYLVNVPILWVAVGEVVALLGIVLRVTRRRPQPVSEGQDETPSER